jgi:hypothetical protein
MPRPALQRYCWIVVGKSNLFHRMFLIAGDWLLRKRQLAQAKLA